MIVADASWRHGFGAVAIALCTGGCGGLTLPDRAPTLDGTVVFIHSSLGVPAGTPRIRTLRVAQEPVSCDMIEVGVEFGDEALLRLADGEVRRAVEDDFAFGRRVRVWTEGQVDACPWYRRADAVEVFAE